MHRAFKKESTPEWDRYDETEFSVEKIVGKRYVSGWLNLLFKSFVEYRNFTYSAPGFCG